MFSPSKHGLLSDEPQHDMSDLYRLGYDYGLFKVPPNYPAELRPELPIREVFNSYNTVFNSSFEPP